MAQYLSPAWFHEVNEAVGASPALREATAGVDVTLQQVVTGGPEGDLHYWLRIRNGSVHVERGDAQEAEIRPDATVTQSYDTAAAVSRGELTAEEAFLDGRIRLRGDIGVLLRHQGVLNSLGLAVAGVRERTVYR